MRVFSKTLAFFILVLTACVPYHTEAESPVPAEKTEQDNASAPDSAPKKSPAPVDVGSYLLYLQAKQNLDFSTALRYLHHAAAVDSDNHELQSEIFTLLALEGRINEIYSYAEKELEKDPSALLPALAMVTNDVWRGDYRAALKQIEAYPLKSENAFLFSLMEMWLYAGTGDREKALEALEELNQEDLKTLYHFHAALLYDLWDDAAQTKKHYEALLSEPGALSLRVAQVYGNFLLRQNETKKFKTLMEAYKAGSKTYTLLDEAFFTAGEAYPGKGVPKSVPVAKSGLAEAFFDISGSLADKGNPDVSMVFIRFSLFLDPSLSLARFLTGELYEKQGRYDDALKLYEQEQENSETYFASQVRMGVIYAKKGDLKKAETLLRSMAKKRPDLAFPWTELGDIFLANKKYPQAIEAYTEAINRVSGADKSQWVLYYSRGAAYERNNQWDLAEQDLMQALVLAPNQPLTLNYLGYSWAERGKNLPRAKEMLEKAAYLSPRDGAIIDSLGWMHYLLKNYPQAVNFLEKAIALDPGSAVINDHLGDAYWKIGRKREARFQWSKALSVKDDFAQGDRQRVEEKISKGLDVVGDKALQQKKPVKKEKKKKKLK